MSEKDKERKEMNECSSEKNIVLCAFSKNNIYEIKGFCRIRPSLIQGYIYGALA